ncbi:hypothetical protein SNEBB_011177 [Seison nebaliae]|nr:hypothetical protein SNEBB_011177 [Seison nebaliae]
MKAKRRYLIVKYSLEDPSKRIEMNEMTKYLLGEMKKHFGDVSMSKFGPYAIIPLQTMLVDERSEIIIIQIQHKHLTTLQQLIALCCKWKGVYIRFSSIHCSATMRQCYRYLLQYFLDDFRRYHRKCNLNKLDVI